MQDPKWSDPSLDPAQSGSFMHRGCPFLCSLWAGVYSFIGSVQWSLALTDDYVIESVSGCAIVHDILGLHWAYIGAIITYLHSVVMNNDNIYLYLLCYGCRQYKLSVHFLFNANLKRSIHICYPFLRPF
jgi:hypothetical protein